MGHEPRFNVVPKLLFLLLQTPKSEACWGGFEDQVQPLEHLSWVPFVLL